MSTPPAASVRVGSGLDVHAFGDDPGRPLVLCGVILPGVPGLAGHSDGDVACHATCDALLGAAALGDLGGTFGVDDPTRAGADSLALLGEVVAAARAAGYAPVNVDLTIVAQRPRLATHREAMIRRLATVLGLTDDAVSVKATTTDGLGSIGAGEGIACWATCLVVAQPAPD